MPNEARATFGAKGLELLDSLAFEVPIQFTVNRTGTPNIKPQTITDNRLLDQFKGINALISLNKLYLFINVH